MNYRARLLVATIDEMADILRCETDMIHSQWRTWPHFFVGKGKTSASARFVPVDVINHLKAHGEGYGDLTISDKKRTKMEGVGISRRRKAQKQGGISKPKRSGELGSGTAGDSKPKTERVADKFGLC